MDAEQPLQRPTVTLDLGEGTAATWFLDDETADRVDAALTALLGNPDSLQC